MHQTTDKARDNKKPGGAGRVTNVAFRQLVQKAGTPQCNAGCVALMG